MNIFRSIRFSLKKRKQTAIKKKLSTQYADLIKQFIDKEKHDSNTAKDWVYPIWVCWWQGEENMPELVKCCYNSLHENANGHPVHLITEDNYSDFVTIPTHILTKLGQGLISITHFSDILRGALLYEYGGMWIDSTILVTQALPKSLDYKFYSIRFTDFYTVKRTNKGQHIIKGRPSFFLYSEKHNLLLKFMRDFFFAYWVNEDSLINYLLIDYVILLAYESIPEITNMMDEIPYNNPAHNDLRYLMKKNYPYDSSLFESLCKETYLHKLTRKKDFPDYTPKGDITYYKYIKDRYLKDVIEEK